MGLPGLRLRGAGLVLAAMALCPAAALAAEVLIDLELQRGSLPAAQRQWRVQKGDTLRVQARSDQAGELHLHAYRQQWALQPGQTQARVFAASASGRFRFEWHAAGATRGGAHAHAPLAVLDVMPR